MMVLVVTGGSVIGGAVAGELPTVVQAPSPTMEATTTTARRFRICFNHTDQRHAYKASVGKVFPAQRTLRENCGLKPHKNPNWNPGFAEGVRGGG